MKKLITIIILLFASTAFATPAHGPFSIDGASPTLKFNDTSTSDDWDFYSWGAAQKFVLRNYPGGSGSSVHAFEIRDNLSSYGFEARIAGDADGPGVFSLGGKTGGSFSTLTIAPTSATGANRVATFPDATGTVALTSNDSLIYTPQSAEATTTEGTVAYADGSSWQTTTGKGIYVYDSTNWRKVDTIVAEQTFSPADTTPTVAAGNMFVMAATGATITDFDDGVAGQRITIRAVSATTDITDGGNLKLSANFTGDADDTIELYTPDGTTWYEISVSAN